MTNYKDGLYLIPSYMQDGVENYVERGREPGGFLFDVLSNDFQRAVTRADLCNLSMIRDWAVLLTYLPPEAWGSEDRVRNWIAKGGLNGKFSS